jgi:class 3 adenylate cyclase
MLERLNERRTEIATRSAERARLVAEFLPAAAAKRSGDGDDVLEHARNASATVLVLGGIGGLVEGMAETEVRDILAEFVDQLDELTVEFGLERVKIAGSSYYAVCGVSRPLLDHAPRSVGFALAAAEVIADLAAEHDAPLVLRAGVDSGAMSVGLTARDGLVYDVWGMAVTGAADLARHAPDGTVAVSAVVREQLPREFVLVDDGVDGPSSVVTGRVSEAAT